MTIKPVVNQKSGEKKEAHGHNHQESEIQNLVAQGGGRSNRNKTSVEVQESQLRNDVYDDITASRHRISPHKILGRSKREHHHHHHNKRERERGKICQSPQYVQTHNSTCNNNSIVSTSAGNVVGSNVGTSTPTKSTIQHIITTSSSSSIHNHQLQHQQQANQQDLRQLEEEIYSGYNSGDEHLVSAESSLSPDQWTKRDEEFMKVMSERGFIIEDIVEDGACLFRAISLQIYGDQEMHELIRQQTMDYIYQNREYFAHFVTEDIDSYINRKRNIDSHGNHIEIQAMSELYNRPVELYCYNTTPINIFNSEQVNNGYDPLRLSYQRGSHYNAILDPYNGSVGVGLGLAGYKPESQTLEAIRLSEQLEIEKTMFEDKLKTTDWEATNEAIEEQIARESYLQWCRENMQKTARANNNNSSNNSTNNNKYLLSQNSTSSTVTSAEAQINNTIVNNSNSNKNDNCETVTSCILKNETSSKETLQQYHNNNMNNNTNINNNNTNHKNISGSTNNCDMKEIISENQSSLLPKNLTKKMDNLGISSNGSNSLNNNNNNCLNDTENLNAINNKKSIKKDGNSQYDSDTDISSNGSVEQCQHKKSFMTQTKKQHQKSQRKLKRCHSSELNNKRSSLKLNNEKCSPKRQCLKDEIGSPSTTVRHLTLPLHPTASTAFTKTPAVTKVTLINKNFGLPCTSKQAELDCKPISQFYQSLLESSYKEDGIGQLSESEMLQKALEMSRMDFFEEQKRKFTKVNNEKRIDIPDEDSDTLSM